MDLQFIYDGGASKRYHTVDTLRTQDIAAHSFGVAWFCELLTSGEASKNLIMAALAHDLAEHQVGDIPAPAKRRMEIADLFEQEENNLLKDCGLSNYQASLLAPEKRTLKIADCMDGMMFCVRERKAGNKNVDVVYGRFQSYVLEQVPFNTTEWDVFNKISNRWEEVTK